MKCFPFTPQAVVLVTLAVGGEAAAESATPGGQPRAAVSEPQVVGGPPWTRPGYEPPPVEFTLTVGGRVETTARLDDGPARLAVYRQSAAFEAAKGFGFAKLALTGGVERSAYDFAQARSVRDLPGAAAAPWRDVWQVKLGWRALVFLSSRWSVANVTSVRFGFEDGARIGDAVSVASFVAVGYSVSRELTFQAGLGVISRLEDRPLVIPLLGFRWTPAEWLEVGVQGPGLVVTTRPADGLEVGLYAGLDNRQFRLEDRRAELGSHVFEDQQIALIVRARYRPAEWVEVGVDVGGSLYRELELRDADGDRLSRIQVRQAPMVGLHLALEF